MIGWWISDRAKSVLKNIFYIDNLGGGETNLGMTVLVS